MGVPTRYTFTVFTPTYNRAHTLPRVFDSLSRQTFRDFEWLIVDDGSTDDTRLLVERFQKEANFALRYSQQGANAGKHVAFNRGVREAAGDLFLPLDSDDECVPEALARFKYHWDSIPLGLRENFSAVTSLCIDEKGRLVGDRFPRHVLDSDSIELAYTYRVRGEKWGFQKTRILKEYPFPEPQGVKFVPESMVWLAIARRYRTRFVNECLRIYRGDSPAGRRLGTLSASTARGRRIFHAAILNEFSDIRSIPSWARAKSAINYGRYSFLCGLGLRAQLREIRAIEAKTLLVLLSPAALLMSQRDGRRASFQHRRSPVSVDGWP